MGNRRRTDYIVIHTSATNRKRPLTLKSLTAMHVARGFSGPGYNTWTPEDGSRIRVARGYKDVGAHVRGWNTISHGHMWAGGHKGYDMTPTQEKALLRDVKKLCKMYPGAKVTGHRDLSPDLDGDGIIESHEWTKQCPWFNAEAWAKSHGLPAANFSGHDNAHFKQDSNKYPPDERDAWLQGLLREEGFTIVRDGYVGPKTKEAIALFQSDYDLPVTRKFDEETVKLLMKRADKRREKNAIRVVRDKTPAVAMAALTDVASVDRVSTKKITSVLTGTGGMVATAQPIVAAMTTTKSLGEQLVAVGPWVILGIVLVGGAIYIWSESNRQQKASKNAIERAGEE